MEKVPKYLKKLFWFYKISDFGLNRFEIVFQKLCWILLLEKEKGKKKRESHPGRTSPKSAQPRPTRILGSSPAGAHAPSPFLFPSLSPTGGARARVTVTSPSSSPNHARDRVRPPNQFVWLQAIKAVILSLSMPTSSPTSPLSPAPNP